MPEARWRAREVGRNNAYRDMGKTKNGGGRWPWGSRSRRKHEVAAEDNGNVCLCIDMKGCLVSYASSCGSGIARLCVYQLVLFLDTTTTVVASSSLDRRIACWNACTNPTHA